MNKITKAFGNISIIVLIFINIVLVYWMVVPVKPIEYENVEVLTPQVKAGSYLMIKLDFYKSSVYPAQISRTLVSCNSKRIYPLPIETGALPPGKYEAIFSIRIPEIVEPGTYRIVSIAVYEVNPLSNSITRFTSPCFEVVAK